MSQTIQNLSKNSNPSLRARKAQTTSSTLSNIIRQLDAKRHGERWQAKCPAHDDNKPSLSISTGDDGRILLHCHAGCAVDAITTKLGLTLGELFNGKSDKPTMTNNDKAATRRPSVIATYEYRDEQGELLFEVQRKSDKSFTCRKPKQGGGWDYRLGATRRVLYRLPELLDADQGATVFICEGEKDADALAALGLVATTNPHGAGKWRDEYNECLQAREVIILPDNDVPGRDHSYVVANALHNVAASVRVLPLPDLPEKGDASDWLNAGGDAEQLCVLAEQATEFKTTTDEASASIETNVTASEVASGKKDWFIKRVQTKASFFHNADTDAYACVQVNGHLETYALKSRSFQTWLNGEHFNACNSALASDYLKEVRETLNAIGVYKGDECEVGIRVMEHQGNVYLDLCDREWRVVEIKANEWRILAAKDSPVKFVRTQGMQPLPEPVRGGTMNELKPFLNSQLEDNAWALIVGWLVMALHPFGPYPLLSISGEQGSAKSTATRVLRSLIDPNRAAARAKPRDERDLMIAASNSWIIAFDNLSGVTQEQSDALCRVATGAAFATRRLHTDREEEIFTVKRPQILNGINENSEFPDLLDRAVSVFLPTIEKSSYVPEKKFWKDFEQAQPRILGALLDAASCALANYETVELKETPRMADFAQWAVAAEPALGLEPETFITAYMGNREIANAISLDVSPAKELKEWADQQRKQNFGSWSGKVAALLDELDSMLRGRGEDPKKKLRWPQAPNRFSGHINRIAPNLRSVGIDIQLLRKKDGAHVEVIFSP